MSTLSLLPNIISIGASCRARFQIERHFRIVHPSSAYPSFFWDWLWFGGAEGVIWTLENDFGILQADFCLFRVSSGRYQLQHAPSGLIFLHDFGEHDSEEEAFKALKSDWTRVSGKYAFLVTRTRALISSKATRIAFVYQGVLQEKSFVRLNGLLDIGGAGRNVLVNVLQTGEKCNILCEKGYVASYVNDEGSGKPARRLWEGCDACWDNVLTSLPFTPDYNVPIIP